MTRRGRQFRQTGQTSRILARRAEVVHDFTVTGHFAFNIQPSRYPNCRRIYKKQRLRHLLPENTPVIAAFQMRKLMDKHQIKLVISQIRYHLCRQNDCRSAKANSQWNSDIFRNQQTHVTRDSLSLFPESQSATKRLRSGNSPGSRLQILQTPIAVSQT